MDTLPTNPSSTQAITHTQRIVVRLAAEPQELIMRFGALIIGDEILSGRRQDQHLPHLIAVLRQRGLTLHWAQYLSDDRAHIAQTLQHTLNQSDLILVAFGGIGATPDDHTRHSAAIALDRPLVLHPQAEQLIRQRFGEHTTPQRLRMGDFPQGSNIIPNPINQMPGFSYQHHYFLPGFPEMAWPMLAWILDTHYAHLFHQHKTIEHSIRVEHAHESELIDILEQLEQNHDVSIFSLPTLAKNDQPGHIELGIKGAPQPVEAALQTLIQHLKQHGLHPMSTHQT